MPPSESQIYARQLLPKGHGYPLWIPEPPDTHPDEYKAQGVEIGDVGIITGDGAFKFIFNICRSSDDPINFLGVPVGFEQVTLASTDLCSHLQRYSCGSHIASTCISKKKVRIDLSSSDNPMIPANASVGMAFTSSSNEGAVLALPTGASQHDLEPVEDFLDYAMRHAVRWYEFVNVTLRRRVYNGSLYLVTGCDKTASWGVASFSNASGSGEIFLQYKAMQVGGASALCEWQWETHSPAAVRSGPKFVGDGQGQPQNQCVFLRGYKVAVREFFPFFKKPVKVYSIVDSKPQNILAQGSSIPFASGSRYSSNRYSESGRANTGGPQDCVDDHWSDEPYHPSTAINNYLLESASVSGAMVAVTHDHEWCSIIDENDSVFPDESEILRRIRDRFIPFIHSSGGVFFVPAGDPHSDDSSSSPNMLKANETAFGVDDDLLHYPTEPAPVIPTVPNSSEGSIDGVGPFRVYTRGGRLKPLAGLSFRCGFPGCNKRFSCHRSVLQHAQDKHPQLKLKQNQYICEVLGCNSSYAEPKLLLQHIRDEHQNTKADKVDLKGLSIQPIGNLELLAAQPLEPSSALPSVTSNEPLSDLDRDGRPLKPTRRSDKLGPYAALPTNAVYNDDFPPLPVRPRSLAGLIGQKRQSLRIGNRKDQSMQEIQEDEFRRTSRIGRSPLSPSPSPSPGPISSPSPDHHAQVN